MNNKAMPVAASGGSTASSTLSSQLAAVNSSNPDSDTANSSTTAKENNGTLKKPVNTSNRTVITTSDIPADPPAIPFTPRRLSFPGRLSLQTSSRGPLSPVLDPALGYSVARRPRLDFARACTSLHHSTLAESSPDSSPLASGGYPIPRHERRLDSPISNSNGYLPGSSHASSLGSASMLDYAPSDDSDSSSDDALDIDLDMDTVTLSTSIPTNPLEAAASLSLRDHQKARLGAKQARRSSLSSKGRPKMSPSPTMQPITQQAMMNAGYGYPGMRRDSLSLGPSALELDIARPDPIRRPVSRRGSLLPKTKNFQRIKAALIEESSPIDVEVRREAEITRQIREDEQPEMSPQPPASGMRTPTDVDTTDNTPEEDSTESSGDSAGLMGNRGIGISFSKQAERHGGFWFGEQMDGIGGSPPAFPGLRHGSDGDIVMNSDSNSPVTGIPPDMRRLKRRRTDEERFEGPSIFKRRAVSPGHSHSPKLAQSPPLSTPSGGGKRLNFQGFSNTHDGLMNMSLR